MPQINSAMSLNNIISISVKLTNTDVRFILFFFYFSSVGTLHIHGIINKLAIIIWWRDQRAKIKEKKIVHTNKWITEALFLSIWCHSVWLGEEGTKKTISFCNPSRNQKLCLKSTRHRDRWRQWYFCMVGHFIDTHTHTHTFICH